MKSVCLVVQMVYDADVRVRRKAEALVVAGYSVDVLALRPKNGRKCYSLNGVNVRTISLGKMRGSLARYCFEYAVFFLWVLVRVTFQTLRRSYAIIDVNTLPDFLIFAPALSKLMGAKLILDMHEITPEFYMSKYGMSKNQWAVRTLTYIEKASMGFADRVITINKPIEDLLLSRGLPSGKSTIIMNSADENRFVKASLPPTETDARAQRKFIMMYHGTLTHIYGLDIAIEAFALAHEEMPGAELWILGSGPEAAALGELAQARGVAGKIRLVGHVEPKEIPGWLSQCEVGILPIRRDVFLDFAFPNKLPEFIIMGKPVIVSRLKAIRHYFSEDALAYFEPNNLHALSRQMICVYQDSQLRTRKTLKAKDEYAPIRWEVMKQRYLTLINDLVGTVDSHSAAASTRATVAGL